MLVATEKGGVRRRRLKAWGIRVIVGVAIFIVVDYILLRLRSSNVAIGLELRDVAIGFTGLASLAAVAVSVWHVRLMHKHARLSVKPLLDFDWTWNEKDGSAQLVLFNDGLGPAIVTELRVAVDNNPLEIATDEQWDNVMKELKVGRFERTIIPKATSIAPKSSLTVIRNLGGARTTFTPVEAEEIAQNRMRVTAAYKSVYDEPFEASMIPPFRRTLPGKRDV